MAVIGPVFIDGRRVAPDDATVSVFDIGLQRGYGCFETLRSYSGKPFRMGPHLDRLAGSAAMLRMALPDRDQLEAWTIDRASEGDVAVKIFVTGGTDPTRPGDGSRTIVFAEPLPDLSAPARLLPLPAPWHPDGRRSELTGAKTFSYATNIAARLAAVEAGYDDALLIGSSGHVLEGPTSGIGWITGETLHTPSLDLGVLASVTVGAVLDVAGSVGLDATRGEYMIDDALDADAVIVMSTLSEVRPVDRIGERRLGTSDIVDRLRKAFFELVAKEAGAS